MTLSSVETHETTVSKHVGDGLWHLHVRSGREAVFVTMVLAGVPASLVLACVILAHACSASEAASRPVSLSRTPPIMYRVGREKIEAKDSAGAMPTLRLRGGADTGGPLVIGIDGGTESIRAGLFREDGTLVAAHAAPYSTKFPQPG